MSETQAMEMLEAPSSPPRRPSLLDDLGISPDSLSINSIGDIAVRRIRENSPTLVLQEATPPATQEKLSSAATDLGRTIRTSASTESLARAAASNGLLAPNIASQRSSEQRSRNTGDKPAGSAGSIAKPPRKGPLVGAMQGRPVSTSLVSLSGHIVPEGESLKESKEMPEPASTTAEAAKPKVRRGASVIHRRLSSKTAEPSVGSPTSHVSDASETGSTSSVLDVDVSRSTARARSTTPETEPPSIASVLQDISPASLQQQAVSSETARPSKGKNVKEKVSKESIVVKQRVSRENVNGESRPRSKSIVSSEESARVQEKNIKDTQSQETVSETSVASLSESQENSAPAATAMREGRRARGAVNYQEPSLSKCVLFFYVAASLADYSLSSKTAGKCEPQLAMFPRSRQRLLSEVSILRSLQWPAVYEERAALRPWAVKHSTLGGRSPRIGMMTATSLMIDRDMRVMYRANAAAIVLVVVRI